MEGWTSQINVILESTTTEEATGTCSSSLGQYQSGYGI